jgi:uncharacterized membrane protein YozB (DUF420 family)
MNDEVRGLNLPTAAKQTRLSNTAAGLLLLSGVTHVGQLAVYDHAGHVIGAAAFGVIYFAIGLWLLLSNRRTATTSRAALWFATLLPTIGGILGIIRFVTLQPNPFTIFHVVIDLIVVPICVFLLVRTSSKG